jgi:hypothetical protein
MFWLALSCLSLKLREEYKMAFTFPHLPNFLCFSLFLIDPSVTNSQSSKSGDYCFSCSAQKLESNFSAFLKSENIFILDAFFMVSLLSIEFWEGRLFFYSSTVFYFHFYLMGIINGFTFFLISIFL